MMYNNMFLNGKSVKRKNYYYIKKIYIIKISIQLLSEAWCECHLRSRTFPLELICQRSDPFSAHLQRPLSISRTYLKDTLVPARSHVKFPSWTKVERENQWSYARNEGYISNDLQKL